MLVRGRPAGRRSRGRRRGAPVVMFAVGLVTATVLVLSAKPAAADPLLPGPNPVDALTHELFARVEGVTRSADALATAPGEIAPPLPALPPLAPALSGLLAASDASASTASPPSTPSPAGAPNAGGTTRLTMGPLRETGTNPILELARSSTALLALALAAALFLAFESVHARHNPRLTAAPLERRDAELEFE